MKSIVSLVLLALFVGLSASQCGKDCCGPGPCSEVTSLTGMWQLQGFRNLTTWTVDSLPLNEDNRTVEFTFKDDESTGTITGHTFVNTVSGAYEMLDYCRFKVISFGGTKVGEPEPSGKAWLNSETIYHYERIGNTLTITPHMGKEAMIFRKE